MGGSLKLFTMERNTSDREFISNSRTRIAVSTVCDWLMNVEIPPKTLVHVPTRFVDDVAIEMGSIVVTRAKAETPVIYSVRRHCASRAVSHYLSRNQEKLK